MIGILAGATDPDADIADAPGAAFRLVFSNPAFGDAGDAAERLATLARIPAPRGFARISLRGAPAAVGVCAIDGEWAGIMGMRTVPAFRRQGFGRRVFRALAHHAAGLGATRGYLQVEQENAAAVALYRSEGFEAAYLYRYWVKP